MIYVCNEAVSVKELADLRESIGWNRMENEYKNPLLTSYSRRTVIVFRVAYRKKVAFQCNLFSICNFCNRVQTVSKNAL